MGTPSSNQYFEAAWTGTDDPANPNLFTAAQIVAGSFDSAAVSTATSKAVSTVNAAAPDSTSISQAKSQAVSAASVGSIADSKAVSGSLNTSVADSKAISVSGTTSVADSKAVSVATATPTITAIVYSANISAADSKAVSIASGVPAQGRGITNVGTYLANNSRFNVADYLVDMTGATDSTSAAQNCYTLASAYALAHGGADVIWPHGTPLITGTIPVTNYRVHTRMAGKGATNITFNPNIASALFKAQFTNAALEIAQIYFGEFTVTGAGSAQKILLDLYDGSDIQFENVVATAFTGNSGSSLTPSIGVRTSGRELTKLKGLTVFADRPIHIVRNPNFPSLSADHFHGQDLYLAAQVSTEANVLVDGDVGMANFTLDGDQAWVGGKYGVYFQSGVAPSTCLYAKLSGFRYEQPADNTGYAVRWEGAAQNLLLEGNMGGAGTPTNGGLYVRNVRKTTLLNALYTGVGASANALNADSTCDEIWQINTTFADSSTITLSGLEEVWSVPQRNSNAPNSPTVYYCNTSTSTRALKVGGVYKYCYKGSVTAGGTLSLPLLTVGNGLKSATLQVAGYSSVGPISEGGTAIATAATASLVGGTTNFAVGNVGAKLCVFYNSGAPVVILNNTAQTLSVVVDITATYT